MIAKATETDLKEGKGFLEAEKSHTGKSFICNWQCFEDAFREGKLLANRYPNGQTNALMIDNPGSDFIIVVREDLRGCGIGKELIEYVLQREMESRGETLWKFEVAPPSAAGFWASLGFCIYRSGRTSHGSTLYAWKKLSTPKTALPSGRRVRVVFRFWSMDHENCKADTSSSLENTLYKTIAVDGILTEDRQIHFAQRVQLHACECMNFDQPASPTDSLRVIAVQDVVVTLAINGNQILLERAKREPWRSMGLKVVNNGLVIDGLVVPEGLCQKIPDDTTCTTKGV